jgi:hypothetical protein
VNSAWEEEIIRSQASLLDPCLDGIACRLRDLELNWPQRLLLRDDCSSRDLVAVADIADFELDEVAATQFAVDAEVEQRELSDTVRHLEANSQRPDVLQLERRLLANDLALVPWRARRGHLGVLHDGLPSVKGSPTYPDRERPLRGISFDQMILVDRPISAIDDACTSPQS